MKPVYTHHLLILTATYKEGHVTTVCLYMLRKLRLRGVGSLSCSWDLKSSLPTLPQHAVS